MVDVTLIIMREDNPVADTPGRWRRGEIVDAFPKARFPASPSNHPRFYHLTVTDVPGVFPRFKNRVLREHTDDKDDPNATRRARRGMRIRYSQMNAPKRNELFTNTFTTITWNQFKNCTRLRQIGSLDDGDLLTDADLDD